MAEPPSASGGAHPSKGPGRSRPDVRDGSHRATEEQESSSCGATTSADSPGDNSGEGTMGSCRIISSDRWAQALSLAIPMGVCGEDDGSAEGKEAAEETPLSWVTFVEPTYTSSSPPRLSRHERSSRSPEASSHCPQVSLCILFISSGYSIAQVLVAFCLCGDVQHERMPLLCLRASPDPRAWPAGLRPRPLLPKAQREEKGLLRPGRQHARTARSLR